MPNVGPLASSSLVLRCTNAASAAPAAAPPLHSAAAAAALPLARRVVRIVKIAHYV
jgi:hypothetical protein